MSLHEIKVTINTYFKHELDIYAVLTDGDRIYNAKCLFIPLSSISTFLSGWWLKTWKIFAREFLSRITISDRAEGQGIRFSQDEAEEKRWNGAVNLINSWGKILKKRFKKRGENSNTPF